MKTASKLHLLIFSCSRLVEFWGIAVGIYRISENVSNFKFYQNVHIAYYHCAKDHIENRTPKMLISRFKSILHDYFDSCLIFKTPITQNSKITCFANLWKR